MIAPLRKLLLSVWSLAKARPASSAVLTAISAGWLLFSALVGMPPWAIVVLPVAVAAMSWGVNRIANRASASGPRQAGILASSLFSLVAVFGLIQLVPYGKSHSNPPVTGEPAWATPETRELMVRACYGCHSNEVVYPAYADVAPISWMVASHVSEGRSKVNYSEFATSRGRFLDTLEVVMEGSMPPFSYTMFGRHPEAKLTDAEVETLVAGLRATPGMSRGN